MLKLLLFFSLLQQTGYKIEGTIKGAEGKRITLVDRAFYNKTHPKISVTADANGRFTFKGTIDEPTYYMITVDGVSAPIELILENANIKIKGDVDSMWTAQVNGSPEMDIKNEFVPFTGYDANEALYNTYEAEHDEALKAGDTTAIPLWQFRRDSLMKSMRAAAGRFINKYPASITAINAVVYYLDDITAADSLVRVFEQSTLKSNKQVVYFRNLIEKKKSIMPGSLAPAFTLKDTSNNNVSLSSFKGKYVLLDFWASWCAPCRQESPNLVKVYNNNKSRGFTIVSVSLDESKEAWMKAIHKDNLGSWSHISDLKGWSNDAATKYGVDKIPTSLLIDREGRIIAKDLRGTDLEKTAAALPAD